jgi:hypothetical protein
MYIRLEDEAPETYAQTSREVLDLGLVYEHERGTRNV